MSVPVVSIYLVSTVPIWIAHLKILDADTFEKTCRRWVAYQYHMTTGDHVKDLTAMSQSIAAQAFNPHGVTAFGMHWQAQRTYPVSVAMRAVL